MIGGRLSAPAIKIRAVVAWLGLAVTAGIATAAGGPVLSFQSSQTTEEKPLRRVELLALENRPEEVTAGLHVELAPGWCLYWSNPGDAGLAPEVRWQLPAGFNAGKLRFPTPQKIVHGDIITYGFTGETLILCDIRRPATSRAEDKNLISAVFEWMACRESCLSGETTVKLNLSSLSQTDTQKSSSVLARFSPRYPKSLPASEIAANGARLIKSAGRWTVEIPLTGPNVARVSDFYPLPIDNFVIDHHRISISAGKLVIPVTPSNPSAVLSILGGLFIIDGVGFEVSIPVKE